MLVKVNGEIKENIDTSSFSVEQNITTKIDIARLNFLNDKAGAYIPKISDEVEIYHDEKKIYAGIIDEISSTWGAGMEIFEATLRDYTKKLEQRYVIESYRNKTISYIVKDIINKFVDDITDDFVDDVNITVSHIAYDYVRPADALRDLAKSSGYEWWVDYDKKLHFVPTGVSVAPFELGDDLHNHIFNSLVLKKSDKQIKNTIYLKGGDTVGTLTKDKLSDGDGLRKRFNLPYKYDEKPTVYLNDVSQKVGIDFINEFGTADNFKVLYNFQEKVITFETAPAQDDKIEVEGLPLYPILSKVRNNDTSKGVYEYKIIDKRIKSSDEARRRAEAELKAYSKTMEAGSFKTERAGLRAGHKITINSEKRNIVNETYLISQIIINMVDGNTPIYSVKLANTATYEITEFIRDLLRSGEREAGIFRDESQIIDVILTFKAEKINLSEGVDIKENMTILEIVNLGENVSLSNLAPEWVWGDYNLTDPENDPKREAMWDSGATWG